MRTIVLILAGIFLILGACWWAIKFLFHTMHFFFDLGIVVAICVVAYILISNAFKKKS